MHPLASTARWRVALPVRDGVVPLIAGFASKDRQAALLKVHGLANTGPCVFKLHHDGRSETEGGDHGSKARFAINVGGNALAWLVFVDVRLIERLKWFNRLKTFIRLDESGDLVG